MPAVFMRQSQRLNATISLFSRRLCRTFACREIFLQKERMSDDDVILNGN